MEQWRPLTEPPESEQAVLICVWLRAGSLNPPEVALATYCEDEGWYDAGDFTVDATDERGYWRPLPPLPDRPVIDERMQPGEDRWPNAPGWYEVWDIREPADTAPMFRCWKAGVWSPAIPAGPDGLPRLEDMRRVENVAEGVADDALRAMRFKHRADLPLDC